MMADGEGRIVNISSIIASTGYNGLSVYGATKAAATGFTRSLAREVGKLGITVNAIAPGFIDTELTQNLVGRAAQAHRRPQRAAPAARGRRRRPHGRISARRGRPQHHRHRADGRRRQYGLSRVAGDLHHASIEFDRVSWNAGPGIRACRGVSMRFLQTFQLYDFFDTLVSLFTAFVFGTLIGAERQYRQRSAGLRTNVLVCGRRRRLCRSRQSSDGSGRQRARDRLCGLRHRLSRRRRDHEGRHECPRPQYGGDLVGVGGGRRLRRRRHGGAIGGGHAVRARRQHAAAAAGERHRPHSAERADLGGALRGRRHDRCRARRGGEGSTERAAGSGKLSGAGRPRWCIAPTTMSRRQPRWSASRWMGPISTPSWPSLQSCPGSVTPPGMSARWIEMPAGLAGGAAILFPPDIERSIAAYAFRQRRKDRDEEDRRWRRDGNFWLGAACGDASPADHDRALADRHRPPNESARRRTGIRARCST